MARLKEEYHKELVPLLKDEFGLKNVMEVPRLEKIVVNMGVGDAISNVKLLDASMEDLATITGQRPRLNRARVSVASFKLREGMPIGCKVTLRGTEHRRSIRYEERLKVHLPPIRAQDEPVFQARSNSSRALADRDR